MRWHWSKISYYSSFFSSYNAYCHIFYPAELSMLLLLNWLHVSVCYPEEIGLIQNHSFTLQHIHSAQTLQSLNAHHMCKKIQRDFNQHKHKHIYHMHNGLLTHIHTHTVNTLQPNIKHRSQSVFPSLSFSHTHTTQAWASGVWDVGYPSVVMYVGFQAEETNEHSDESWQQPHVTQETASWLVSAPPIRDVWIFSFSFLSILPFLSYFLSSTSNTTPVGAVVVILYNPEKQHFCVVSLIKNLVCTGSLAKIFLKKFTVRM